MIKIGCCGFPVSRERYVRELSVVELQNTFYDLPSRDWCKRLRDSLPSGFEIAVKVWQVITHPSTSPTWRRMKSRVKGDVASYGHLKHTKENLEAFMEVYDRARILGARFIILQTPSSMPCTTEHLEAVDSFFKDALKDISNMLVGWELRGECADDNRVTSLMEKHGIIHVVDPFKRKPFVQPGGIAYFRLHGRGAGEINYRYKYSDEDLVELYKLITELDVSEVYVMFNNIYMFEDAVRFKRLLKQKGVNVY
ncbi:MAG: DUF72 domain-containing protein [Desulfurococcus sp.]|nr:DUF72 domain-containing protein [Desulfurococcus sp.]